MVGEDVGLGFMSGGDCKRVEGDYGLVLAELVGLGTFEMISLQPTVSCVPSCGL